MPINGQITTVQGAKTTTNLFAPFLTFSDQEFEYTFSDGAGNVEVANRPDTPLSPNISMRIRALTDESATWNAGANTNTVIPETDIYIISYEALKTDDDADINLSLEVYVNDTLTDANTMATNFLPENAVVNNKWNTVYQSFQFNSGDVVSLQWTFRTDTVNAYLYIRNFKLERANEQQLTPSFYTKPNFLNLKWQSRYDNTNTPTLVESTETQIGFVGTIVDGNTDVVLVATDGTLQPTKKDALFRATFAFNAEVPSGGNNYIRIDLKENDVITQTQSFKLFEEDGNLQGICCTFEIPVTEAFLVNGGGIFATAQNSDIILYNRKLIATEQINSI
jgi:hypothetical protein